MRTLRPLVGCAWSGETGDTKIGEKFKVNHRPIVVEITTRDGKIL
jgi:hypothetical protein